MRDIIVQTIIAFVATLCFAVLFNAEKRELVFCGLTGALGWFIYIFVDIYTRVGTAVFLAAFGVTLISRILAVVRKDPVTIFLIPGIIPLVPGSGIYNTMYNALSGNSTGVALHAGETFTYAGAIAIGIVVALSLPNRLFNPEKPK